VTVDQTVRTRRIAVNTAIYLHGTSGSATATRAITAALRTVPGSEVVEVSPGPRGRSSVGNAVRDARWDLWQASRRVPDVDLLVSPCNIGLRGRARKHLLVVYDVMVFDRPDLFDRRFATYFRLLVPPSIRSADRVLTLSEHAAARLRRIAPGADVRVLQLPHEGAVAAAASPGERRDVLMVGVTDPVKNHVAGAEAVARLRAATGADVRLRVIGPVGRAEAELRAALARLDPDEAWTRREVDVTQAVLESAYASSWLLLQPSLDEGYGLPLVEAARHGLPVVHSGRGALPSVLAALDAGGVSPELLAAAMQPLLAPDAWAAASVEVLARAEEMTPERFYATVVGHALDLLGETGG
jgi:glycosyltransferase involved in cell wall biosynthesis